MRGVSAIALSVVLMLMLLAAGSAPLRAADEFVRIQGDQFTYKGQVVRMKGSNYYPRDHMWADMWNSWDWTEIVREADLMQGLGLNCVRILVPYWNGGWGGPNPPADRLQKLEDLVNMLGQRGIRSCVTLFDWETSFPAAGTSTERDHLSYVSAIVGRLKNNPNVFMWDVKNEPDHPANIGGVDNWDGTASKSKIVDWLHRMCDACRAIDPNHPASAGLRWWQNINDVMDFVDVAIFHSYWPNVAQEIDEARSYMGANQKPILCEEFGWPTNPNPCNRDGRLIYDYNEDQQLYLYTLHLTEFQNKGIAGCIQWMTFDARSYTTNQDETFEKFFGLWRYDYSLKPAGAYYRDHFPVRQFTDPPEPVACGVVKQLAAGSKTAIGSKVVSAVFAPEGCIYVQDQDRSGGIRVSTGASGLSVGDVVNVTGTLVDRVLSGRVAERQVVADSVVKVSAGQAPRPLGTNCAAVGGAAAGAVPGVNAGLGLNNIGLLVKVTGRVTYAAGSYIFVDDGTGVDNLYGLSTPTKGVMVRCAVSPGVVVGDMVSATGVVAGSVPLNWTTNRRYVQARTAEDVAKF